MVTLNGARSVLDLIGSTPVVRLRALPGKNDAEVWAKMESFNPGGSVKDRICLNMIATAESEGKLKPGATIVVTGQTGTDGTVTATAITLGGAGGGGGFGGGGGGFGGGTRSGGSTGAAPGGG